jgi:hypothetical protein
VADVGRATDDPASIESDNRSEGDLLDLVRARSRWVASQASSVSVELDRLGTYASTLTAASAGRTGPDPWTDPAGTGDVEAHVALVVALDAVNFGSGYHPHVTKLAGRSGARTMATRLRTWADEQGGIRADALAALDRRAAHRIFAQPETDEMVELMGLFAIALNELGRTVASDHDGSFVELVGAAEGSGARLVELLAALPTYADVSAYRGFDVPFLKRAQLTAADLHRAFGGRGPGAFTDIDRLTAFADNLVPHVLRIDGVLALDPGLEARIDRGELLVHGEEAEVELRACAVDAVERLRSVLLDEGVETTSAALDQALWERGGDARYKAVPRPRARTSAY